jgi:hypothetical protein
VHERLAPFGRLRRIENRLETGTPDVNYCLRYITPQSQPATGWAELKHLDQWPARATTRVTVPKLTLDQVMWAEDWHGVGGRAWLLLRIRRDVILLQCPLIRALYQGELTKADLRTAATVFGEGRFPTVEVLRWLTAPMS